MTAGYEQMVTHAYLVGRGVKPISEVGFCTADEVERVRALLESAIEETGGGCSAFAVPADGQVVAFGFFSEPWTLESYQWLLLAPEHAVPRAQRNRLRGLLFGYSPSAIQDFDAAAQV